MVRRSRKKSRTFRGHRSHGYGAGKKHRGLGCHGGNPNKGWNKRHWIRTLILYYDEVGKHGFTSVWQRTSLTANVGQLDQVAEMMVEKNLATREGKKIVIDASKLKLHKILGSGKVTRPLVLIASNVSESARLKIEGAGGEIRNAK